MRRRPLARSTALAVLATAALAATACAPQESATTDDGAAAGGGSCTPDDLATVTEGTLTIATDTPAYEPWFVDDDPTNGEGYESAVAYAVAERLGYSADEVEWTSVQFNTAITPGEKDFDFDINQFTITAEREAAVDFSSAYYTATQAVITTGGSAADGATSLADLAELRIGAQVATTSLTVLTDVIGDPDPVVFNTNDDAKLALQNGQVDAIVVDLPTAFYITAAELDDGVIVGQVADSGAGGDEFGLLLTKDSPLTDCVSDAVDALREDGTLDALQREWLADVADAPVLS